MSELSDLSETDASNTSVSGFSTDGSVANMSTTDNVFQSIMGLLKRWFKSSLFRLRDSTDQTKLLGFDLSGITTATTRTIVVPDASGTLLLTTTLPAASQVEQEAGTSLTTFVSPGRQQFHPSAAKFSLKCGVSGNILYSYNITSIADPAVGRAVPTIEADFTDANYVIVVSNNDEVQTAQVRLTNVYSQAFNSFGMKTVNATDLIDPVYWYAAGYGVLA